MSASDSKVILIRCSAAATKVIDYPCIHNRYRYYKNAIISQVYLLLVGVSDCSLLEDVLIIVRTM